MDIMLAFLLGLVPATMVLATIVLGTIEAERGKRLSLETRVDSLEKRTAEIEGSVERLDGDLDLLFADGDEEEIAPDSEGPTGPSISDDTR